MIEWPTRRTSKANELGMTYFVKNKNQIEDTENTERSKSPVKENQTWYVLGYRK